MKAKKTIVTLIVLFTFSTVAVQLTTACGSKANTGNKVSAAATQTQAQKKPEMKPAPAPAAARPKPSAGPAETGTSTTTTDQNGYTITITSGYDTDSQDHGRPIVLIAAALGVPAEVFREAFSGVTPAGTGSGGPTSEQAQSNKTALLKVLGPYGITNDRLDEVSNYYRYNGTKGEVWTRTAATATTILTNGIVTGVKITNAGAGYSSAPTITITGADGKINATAEVIYTTDFKTNGSLASIKIK